MSATFNTVLGEELLFRGLLLPRMNGAFKRYPSAWIGIVVHSLQSVGLIVVVPSIVV